jgi:hypothetical protein
MTHPITPPPELVQQWCTDAETNYEPGVAYSLVTVLAARSAQWGAEERTHAICAWLDHPSQEAAHLIGPLLAHFCPKDQSLKEQAKEALGRFSANSHTTADAMVADFEMLRRALEALPDS